VVVSTPLRSFVFAFGSAATKDEWMTTLQSAVQRLFTSTPLAPIIIAFGLPFPFLPSWSWTVLTPLPPSSRRHLSWPLPWLVLVRVIYFGNKQRVIVTGLVFYTYDHVTNQWPCTDNKKKKKKKTADSSAPVFASCRPPLIKTPPPTKRFVCLSFFNLFISIIILYFFDVNPLCSRHLQPTLLLTPTYGCGLTQQC
jgi:hypothetical protein